jgi:hypothetical protein
MFPKSIFIITSTLSIGYLWNRYNNNKNKQCKNKQFLIKYKNKHKAKFKYFNKTDMINDQYKCETECALTSIRLAYEFTGIHCSDWVKSNKINCDEPIFVVFFYDYSDDKGNQYGHQALVKDGYIYQSYLGTYRLKKEKFTERKKKAIQEYDHKYFAFELEDKKKSVFVDQLIPPDYFFQKKK